MTANNVAEILLHASSLKAQGRFLKLSQNRGRMTGDDPLLVLGLEETIRLSMHSGDAVDAPDS
jgi:hypothetical protein